MGKSAPAAPDYASAAKQQGVENRQVNADQTWANRPTQNTPWGKISWGTGRTIDPGTGKPVTTWEQNLDLNPEMQSALSAQQRTTNLKSQLAEGLTGRMQGEFGKAMDWSRMPTGAARIGGYDGAGGAEATRRRVEDSLYRRATSRMDPQWREREAAERNRLTAQGLRQGDEAYDRAMRDFEFGRTDAYEGARTAAVQQGGAEATRDLSNTVQAGGFNQQLRQQAVAEELQRRGFSLNEINAILSGQQVSMPSMPSFSLANRAEAAPIFAGAQATGQANLDRFNAEQQAMQGMMSGITDIAGSFAF